jgi:hypothetical protein
MHGKRTALYLAGMVLGAVFGCKHPPDLKPPEQPEVLASPGDKDKRYELPCNYPADVLASDPNKKQDGILPASGKRGGGGQNSMGMTAGPGGGGSGTPPLNN